MLIVDSKEERESKGQKEQPSFEILKLMSR